MSSLQALERQLLEARADFAEGLGGATILIEQNASEISRVELRVDVHMDELKALRDRMMNVEAQLPERLRERLATAEQQTADYREATGKIRTLEIESARDLKGTERTKARWAAITAVGVAVITGVLALILQLVRMFQN